MQTQRVRGGYHKFGGAERLGLCRRNALGVVIINLVAKAVEFVQTQRVRGGYHKFGGAERLGLCRRNALGVVIINLVAKAVEFVQTQRVRGSLRDYVAQAVEVVQDGTVGRICKSAPTVFLNSMVWGGWVCGFVNLWGGYCMMSRWPSSGVIDSARSLMNSWKSWGFA